ncbi:MAG: Coenzyme F420 hydrogenase/dehydrogenase, beta subunit C-terminal domain [Akkermansia sp.]|nr:Coenzyme F420 hydrogenase/dehydrogenase, beta subunit C-terminal domain [Akkermansia sp.]
MNTTSASQSSRYITPPLNCTGCGLCANVCGHDAIQMSWSKEGFLVPQVKAACINCGACVKACPAQPEHLTGLRKETEDKQPLSAYGGWNSDKDMHLASSSGGIFTALAELIFAAGGCVFGVVWENKDTAKFTKAENKEELAGMRGSKYIQAVPGMVYREVKTELKKGRQVLFIGTSCQVYALKRYLRKDYESLLLIDILCHGVPSRNLLQSYIREMEATLGKELACIQFRDKAGNWQQYQVKKIFSDGSSLSHVNREDMFMRIFIGDFVLNKACYSCPHARFPRVGDITLGDFWGDLQNLHPDWPIHDGIGSVLGNTPKGKALLQELSAKGAVSLMPDCLDNLIGGQRSTYIRDNTTIPANREQVLRALKEDSLSNIHHKLFDFEKCGPFRVRKNSFLHKMYIILRAIKRKIS